MTPGRLRRARSVSTVALALAAACGSGTDEPRRLELVAFVQDHHAEVYLDEPLVLHFSAPLDRTSINASTLRIRDAEGEVASGRLRIDGRTLTFFPDLPREPDLDDGGLRPGETYRVELRGFPRPDGIRSVEGWPLAASRSLVFRTSSGTGGGQLFVDALPDPGGPLGVRRGEIVPLLRLEQREIGPLDPLELTSTEPVDPRSLSAGEFELFPREGDVTTDVIALRPRLVENGRSGARVELFPQATGPREGSLRALEPGTYYLRRARLELRDLTGRALRVPWDEPAPGRDTLVPIEVLAPRTASETITFDSASRRWFGEPFGFDGTAHWPDQGTGVTIRFPRAAGDGSDGPQLALTDLGGRTDLNATHVVVPRGSELDLGSTHGFLVLRAQGSLEIEGTLRRQLPPHATNNLADELRRRAFEPPESWETLSDWLVRARRWNEPWTVLVAGGELRVTGRIVVDGPLMLVAGGWVRIYGRVEAGEVWKSPEGGDNVERVRDVPLVLDQPETNVLRVPLRYGILSNPIRPESGVEAWRSATLALQRGGGEGRLRFLGLRDRSDGGGSDEYGPVEDLTLLTGCRALRLLIELELPAGAGEPWDPPRLEAVELSWHVRRFD
jgi:hypothetical protein